MVAAYKLGGKQTQHAMYWSRVHGLVALSGVWLKGEELGDQCCLVCPLGPGRTRKPFYLLFISFVSCKHCICVEVAGCCCWYRSRRLDPSMPERWPVRSTVTVRSAWSSVDATQPDSRHLRRRRRRVDTEPVVRSFRPRNSSCLQVMIGDIISSHTSSTTEHANCSSVPHRSDLVALILVDTRQLHLSVVV